MHFNSMEDNMICYKSINVIDNCVNIKHQHYHLIPHTTGLPHSDTKQFTQHNFMNVLNSILRGVAFGYILYIMIGLFTGDMIENTIGFYTFYTTPSPIKDKKPLAGKYDISSRFAY